jgi:pimeloyl-ACP methyl ester carboxylesterase
VADQSPAVVLVHGFATSAARTWGETGWTDLLADAGRRVVPIDLLGHGESPKPHEPEAYDRMEEIAFDSFPEEPVDAVGFSLGARTLLVLASAHPERFHRLVVAGVGANLFRHDDSSHRLADAVEGAVDGAAKGADADGSPIAQYFRGQAAEPGNDPLALAACMRRPGAPAITDEGLARIQLPVLIVLGDRDFAGPAEPLAERLPDASVVTLRNVDHFATPKDFGFLDAGLDFLGASIS